MIGACAQFRDAIRAAGLTPPDVIEPGRFHRFPGEGKRNGNTAGWCKLFGDERGGIFGDHSTGITETWHAKRTHPMTAAEREALSREVEEAKAQARAQREAEYANAAQIARQQWEAAKPAHEDHPYLAQKRVKPHGVRQDRERLVIPLQDASGALHSLQFITPESEKKFFPSGRVKGCYFTIGEPNGSLCVAEGYATGATIHEATGRAVAVAFNASNLGPVARALREKYPELTIILCADDDYATPGNPGLTKATEAARAIDGFMAVPEFEGERPQGATDFNDLATFCGPEAVESAIARAMSPPRATETSRDGVTGVTGVQASSSAAPSDTPSVHEGVTGEPLPKSPIPEESKRPTFRVFDEPWHADGRTYPSRVWFFGIKPGKGHEGSTLWQTRVSSPLHVVAVTFDGQDNNFGRLLRFKNTLGRWREWAMPMELLRASGDELRGELLAMGVEIDPSAKTLLANYLQAKPPQRRMRCALQVGWCGDSYVLPDRVIGPSASEVIFQSGERGHDEHTEAGTLTQWQAEIASRAIGNPMLVLALSAAFAGPLLARCNAEGGGIHFVGDSSTGKTTLIEAACSVWGGSNFRRSWRATANGMEGAAALFNDCLLALDEISECDPSEVGAIVYALGNGRGKQRANRFGSARAVNRWRCFIVSSGERTIATAMQEGGHRAKAGQAVRILDVPVAGKFGSFDELHDGAGGAAFADALKGAAGRYHGHAGRAFLEKLTRDGRDFCALLERTKGLRHFATSGNDGQDKRAAARFALVAVAGELGTEYGLTGWAEGGAMEAAGQAFAAWQRLRGHGNDERRRLLEQLSGFIDRHGDARFSSVEEDETTTVRDRAGWWRDMVEGRVYLFTAEGMREAVKGFDFNRALDALQEAGALAAAEADGKRSRTQRLGGRLVRVYPITIDKLESAYGA